MASCEIQMKQIKSFKNKQRKIKKIPKTIRIQILSRNTMEIDLREIR